MRGAQIGLDSGAPGLARLPSASQKRGVEREARPGPMSSRAARARSAAGCQPRRCPGAVAAAPRGAFPSARCGLRVGGERASASGGGAVRCGALRPLLPPLLGARPRVSGSARADRACPRFSRGFLVIFVLHKIRERFNRQAFVAFVTAVRRWEMHGAAMASFAPVSSSPFLLLDLCQRCRDITRPFISCCNQAQNAPFRSTGFSCCLQQQQLLCTTSFLWHGKVYCVNIYINYSLFLNWILVLLHCLCR